jgi:hypothetical protein
MHIDIKIEFSNFDRRPLWIRIFVNKQYFNRIFNEGLLKFICDNKKRLKVL